MTGRLAALAALLALLALWPAGPATAQVSVPEGDTLDAVEAALDSGRTDRARSLLESWTSGREEVAGAEQGRVRFLRARLTTDADSAETLYLSLALEGDGRYGDRAWLRLAQLHLARGEPSRARSELERLRSDYPSSALIDESWYWTGLAAADVGEGEAACSAWRRAAAAGGATAERAAESLERCEDGTLAAAGARDTAAGRGAGEAGTDAAGPPDARGAEEASGFAVQLGAFSERERARELIERAREAGFEVRAVGPSPRDGLIRVRTRAVSDRGEAAELVRRLEARGFSVMVVNLDESSRDETSEEVQG